MSDSDSEEAVTVAIAAVRLGCDPATVRALLRAGELEGFMVGKCSNGRPPGGVRIEAASIRSYKERHRIGAIPAGDVGKHRPALGVGHYDAKRRLRERGVILEPEDEDEKRFWAGRGQRHRANSRKR